MMHAPMPGLRYEYAPCPQCGALTAAEAEDACLATQGMDGDYHCAGNDCMEDDAGRFKFPTAESIAALDAWYGEQGRAHQQNGDKHG